jgi:hypothetical protein
VVSLTSRPLHPWYQLERRLGEPKNPPGRHGEEKTLVRTGTSTPARLYSFAHSLARLHGTVLSYGTGRDVAHGSVVLMALRYMPAGSEFKAL